LLDVVGADGPIVTGDELGRPGGVRARPDDVFDLGGVGKRMQVRGASCAAASASPAALSAAQAVSRSAFPR
jgi:hypothetical protein